MTEAGSRATERSIPRLTVARASAAERRSVVEQARCPVVDADGLTERATALAAARHAERAAAHQRAVVDRDRAADACTLAAGREGEIRARQEALEAGAAWAAEAEAEVAAAHAELAAAEAEVEARQAAQRTALAELDKVLEQRAAAASAMAEAEAQLEDLGVSELDESGLRRELEASGHAVREAQEAHAAAVAALQARQQELAAASEALAEAERAAAELADEPVEADVDVEGVAVALERWKLAAELAGPDETATALADAWTDLQADLASVVETAPLPDPAEVEAAEARVEEAARHLAAVEAAAGAGELSPEARAEIEAAHQAVLEAEERANRRIGAGAARKALERAKEHEAELLAKHGFASYIDVVLTGGRPRQESPELIKAARAYRAAVAERDALVEAATASPELTYLHGERARLHQHCVDLLGVDPGDEVVALLWEHPAVPADVVTGLRDALAEVGVHPVGVSLPTAAAAWLDRHAPSADEAARRAEERTLRHQRVATLTEERDRLVQAVADAEQAVADAADALERASRTVSAFESELSMRADEDARRLQRFAAAEQLRAQIESLTRTLDVAEADARRTLEEAASALAVAEAELDRAGARVGDLQRRARSLLSEVPADQRPDGEPLAVLAELVEPLRAAAARLEPELTAAAEQRAAAAADLDEAAAQVAAAEATLEGPQPEDHLEALRALLEESDRVVVLDEPLAATSLPRDAVCEVLLGAGTRPVVLLTEDPELLGWAIELPSDRGRVVPIDALNLGPEPADEQTMERAILELSDQGSSVDVEAPIPPAPRWAGRR